MTRPGPIILQTFKCPRTKAKKTRAVRTFIRTSDVTGFRARPKKRKGLWALAESLFGRAA